ncbi:MAG: LysR family transcriptional regulator [Tepidisphaeraceae bacterium]
MSTKPNKSARRPKMATSLRGRLWVDAGSKAAFTDATADLLEQIDVCGSLSEAARRLRFAYRRAWLLLDAANHAWPHPLVTTATGGKRGGGCELTEFGRHVLATYRDLQVRLEHLLDEAGDPFSV